MDGMGVVGPRVGQDGVLRRSQGAQDGGGGAGLGNLHGLQGGEEVRIWGVASIEGAGFGLKGLKNRLWLVLKTLGHLMQDPFGNAVGIVGALHKTRGAVDGHPAGVGHGPIPRKKAVGMAHAQVIVLGGKIPTLHGMTAPVTGQQRNQGIPHARAIAPTMHQQHPHITPPHNWPAHTGGSGGPLVRGDNPWAVRGPENTLGAGCR